MILFNSKSKEIYKEPAGSDRPVRSVVKAISWRVIGTLDTIGISWILTGEVETALAIGAVELVTKMALYIGHERIWNKITFGKG